ncbi:MAG: DUF4097 family beta strand repeat protein [Saprospiraceae bacterium]|nr:DUF4097 family beta strand repeat protein [Saprospiraceae bacterium]
MKNTRHKICLTWVLCSLLSLSLFSQANHAMKKVTIELSKPSEKGMLELHIQNGTITVIGEDRQDVELGYLQAEKESTRESKGSLKRIVRTAVELNVSEYSNTIEVDADNNRIDFVVHVPRNFDLSLRSHHHSDIMVEGVTGQMEVQSHHGGIEMRNVSGSVSAETHHGPILVTFESIDLTKPMAFSTYHGDVELTLPAGIDCSTRMKPGRGDIYTDFDMTILADEQSTSTTSGGAKEIKIGGWTRGQIGSGGSEVMLTTYHGDIILRKA